MRVCASTSLSSLSSHSADNCSVHSLVPAPVLQLHFNCRYMLVAQESCINTGPKLMLPWTFKDLATKEFHLEYPFCSVLSSRMLVLWMSSLKYLSHLTSTEVAYAADSWIYMLSPNILCAWIQIWKTVSMKFSADTECRIVHIYIK